MTRQFWSLIAVGWMSVLGSSPILAGSPASVTAGFPGLPDIPDLPAMLLLSNPSPAQQNVALDTPVTFTFATAMDPAYSVTWSPNVTAANFTYAWNPSGTVLTATYAGGFPANATITWTLDPAVFKDKAGTPLLPFNNSGSFTTGSGQSNPDDPCDGGPTDPNLGSLSLFKVVNYVQTSASAPVIDPDGGGAVFSVSLAAPKDNPASEASVELPNGTVKPLTLVFGHLFLFEEFDTQEALDAAYPSGVYKVTLKLASGTKVLNLDLGTAGAPPTPQLSNYPQTQAFDPASDFTLQWLPYTGVRPEDSLFVEIHDAAGASFSAPDPCVPRLLPNTATSVVVPKNTFGASGEKDGSLSFGRWGSVDTNSVPSLSAFSGYNKTTTFQLKSSGSTPQDPPQLQSLVRQANGLVEFQVKAASGAVLLVEASNDLKAWTTLANGPAVGGALAVSDPGAVGQSQRFYRARTL